MIAADTRALTVHGQRLRVAVRPSSDRSPSPPLLMLNGIGAGLEVLDPLVAALDPAVEVIRVDIPGAGGSPPGPWPYAFAQLAALLDGLLDRLDRDRADVLGFSWGGGLAQQFALQYPARTRRLVLVSTSTGAVSVPASPVGLWALMTPHRFANARDVADLAGLVDGRKDGRANGRPMALSMGPTDIVGYLHQLAAAAAWTSLPFLHLIRQPTLVVTGTADRLVPPVNSRILARLLPHAALAQIPGGHAAIVTHANALAPRIARFLADWEATAREHRRRSRGAD
jgi:poly(3-hydroxyalkanoate) depolymerase